MKTGVASKAWLWSALLALSLMFGFLLASSDSNAQASRISFDHNRTTYPLLGSHARAQCDSCHSKGIFKGTPRQCVVCHVKGSQTATTYKPAAHIPTRDACDLCHNNVSWAPARMSHHGVLAGSCVSCHNGAYVSVNAEGRTANHSVLAGLPDSQTSKCETCHTTTASWTASSHQHGAGDFGRCSACHNGRNAQGVTSGHIPTSGLTGNCDSCHTSFATFSTATGFNHSSQGIALGSGTCLTCHNGGFVATGAVGKPTDHSTAFMGGKNCDGSGCHANTSSWVVSWVHTNTVGDHSCTNCHGAAATSPGLKLNTSVHVPVPASGAYCDDCHKSLIDFSPAQMDHTVVSAAACETCHTAAFVSQGARAKSSAHIPTTTVNSAWGCGNCHGTTSFETIRVMDHSGTAGKCSTCHDGKYLDYNAQPKGGGHVTTTAQCDSCHVSTNSWATVTVDHTQFSSPSTSIGSHNCANCHNGTTVYGGVKPLSKAATNHIPTTLDCDYCHNNFSSFNAPPMNHAGATTCSTCHNGTFLDQQGSLGLGAQSTTSSPIPHIPSTQECGACHRDATFSSFVVNPQSINGVIHAGADGKCAGCHSGGYVTSNAQAKSTRHIGTGAQCDSCHKSSTSWATTTVDHSQLSPASYIGLHNCDSCHNGTTTSGDHIVLPKPTNHIKTELLANAADRYCDNCHASFAAFSPASMNGHQGTAGKCSSCHNGEYRGVNAQAKSTTHVPTTAECDSCHTAQNTKNYTTFEGATFNHSPTLNCSSCHEADKVSGHVPTSAACTLCHTSAVSGGYTSWTPGLMGAAQHNGTTGPVASIGSGSCLTCHNGGFSNAQSKGSSHVSTTAACDTCHTSGSFTSWSDATYAHSSADTGKCATCHYTGGPGKGKNTAHIPVGSLVCDNCHKTFSAFVPAVMNHTGLTACSDCHTGTPVATYQLVDASPSVEPAGHIPSTSLSLQCSQCHASTTNFYPGVVNHNGTAGSCNACHNGSFTGYGAVGAPSTILTSTGSTVAHSTSTTCDGAGCHASSNFTSWVTTWNHTAYRSTAFPSGVTLASNCASSGCHVSGGGALAPSAQHSSWLVKAGTSGITTTCSTCHTNFTSFAPATMTHSGVATTSCNNCHDGSYASLGIQGKSTTHVASGTDCHACHSTGSNYTSWDYAVPDHAAFTPSAPVGSHTCNNCHTGQTVSGIVPKQKTDAGSHIPTTAQCDVCHSSTTNFSAWTMDHTNGGAAYGSATCKNCHGSGGTALYPGVSAKSGNHIAIQSTSDCKNCHTDTTSWSHWTMGSTGHGYTTGTCVSCHISGGLGKPVHATHIPSGSVDCVNCHRGTGSPYYVDFSGSVMNHAAVISTSCATCHGASSTYTVSAKLNPATHIPQAVSYKCDDCHGSTTKFNISVTMQHSPSHLLGSATCNSCHSGGFTTQVGSLGLGAQTKANAVNHTVTSAQCDSCHTQSMNYTTWANTASKPNHDQFNATTNCTASGCHSSTMSTAPATPHIPTTSYTSGRCGVCHTLWTAWGPTKMNHSAEGFSPNGVDDNTCKACHDVTTYASSGAKTKADKPGHPTTSADCDTCHISSSNWSTVNSHNASTTNCVSCHVAGNTVGAKYQNATTHVPFGTTAYTSAQDCDSCHTDPAKTTGNSYSFTAGVTVKHDSTKSCYVCHNGNYISQVGVLGKGALGTASFANHIPTGAIECNGCHKSTTLFSGAVMSHASMPATTLDSCNNCHANSTYISSGAENYLDNAGSKLGLHTAGAKTVSNVQCKACHASGTYISWADGKYHGATAASTAATSGTCNNCHAQTNTYGIQGMDPDHTKVMKTTPTKCNDCHTSVKDNGFASPLITKAVMNVAIHTTYVAGINCSYCHGKNATYYAADTNQEALRITLGNHKGSTVGQTCAASRCHQPGSNGEGTAYSTWD